MPSRRSFPSPRGETVNTGFHLYAVEWAPNDIQFFFDDHLIAHRTPADLPAGAPWVYNHPFFLILNLAVGGDWPGNPDATTTFPQQMRVEVRPRVHQEPTPVHRSRRRIEVDGMITIGADAAGNGPVLPISRATLTRFLNRARAAVGLVGNVDVLLTSDAELKRLNRTFRGKNKSTDVLSFPADAIPGLPEIHQHAGDLAISLETAARQAASFGHPLETELRILLLHGLLHLAGLDHETDSGEMASRESELRTKLRLPTSLIARTLGP